MTEVKTPRRSWLRTVIVFVVTGVALWPLVYFLCLTISPARTPEGLGLMPLPQLFVATAISPVLGVIAAWIFGRRR
jgi:hypothetical protein